MYLVTLTKNNETIDLIEFESQQKAEDFIASKIAANTFGEVGTYTLKYSNVAAANDLKKEIRVRSLKREFGAYLIDKVSVINESRGGGSTDVDAFMSNPFVKKLLNHLNAGNISTARDLIVSADLTSMFSIQEKAAVVAEIETFLTNV